MDGCFAWLNKLSGERLVVDKVIEQALKRDRVVDITTTGRRSGKPHRIEIWLHYQEDGVAYLSGSPGRRDWYANLLAHPRFTVHVKRGIRADLEAEAEPVTDEEERKRVLAQLYGDNDPGLGDRTVAAPLVRVRLRT